MEKSFGGFVSNCNITPLSMKTFCIRSKYFLFVWNSKDIHIYQYNLTLLEGLPEFNGNKGNLHLENGIVSIINLGEDLYAFDSQGFIILLIYKQVSIKSNDDMHMFDINTDAVHSERHKLMEDCDELLTVTETAGGFAACYKFQDKMHLKIWKGNPPEQIAASIITEMLPCKVFLTFNTLPIARDLKRKYFNFLQEEEQNVLLIGLSSGCVLSFSDSSSRIDSVLSTPHPVSTINWITEGSQCVCVALLIQFLHGAALLLHRSRSQMIYLAGPVHTALLDSSRCVYTTSDGVDCIVAKLHVEDDNCKYECSISPLKGIRSMCPVLGVENCVLVGTQHQCIYWLNPSMPSVGDPSEFEMPEDRLLDSLLASTTCLEKICQEMEREDAIIRAVSLAKRAHSMSQYFTIFAKVYSSSFHGVDKIKVRIETSCDFVNFSCDLWRLELTLLSPQDSASEITLKKLKKLFNCDNPIVCEIEGIPVIGSEIFCCMVASIEADQPWLTFALGKITLDAGYFLTLVTNIPRLKSDMASSTSQSILSPTETKKQIDTVLNLALSPPVLENALFPAIFFNSSHRMLKEQWLNLKDKNLASVDALIGNNIVHIKLDRSSSTLKISSSELETCHLVRQAVLARISSNLDIRLNQQVYIDAEAVRLSFEIEKMKMDRKPEYFKNSKDLIRTTVSKNLPT